MKTLLLPLLAATLLLVTPASATDKKPASAMKPLTLDTNQDGKIALSEANGLAEAQFRLYDGDKSGAMSEAEYRKPLDEIAKLKKFDAAKKAAEEKVIKSSFTRMDNDSNGQISKAEFMSDAELRHKTMDLDNDGFVTTKEVEELHKKIVEAQKKAAAAAKK